MDKILNKLQQKLRVGDSQEILVDSLSNIYLGMFYYYGFEIISIKRVNMHISILLRKTKDVEKNLKPKKYGLLITLPRRGKNGKRIFVYKFRTMQPYSEYIQDFVVSMNGLNKDGTIHNDFRITKWGRFLRKYWLDELPMLINFFKGELKLIGVRPLSDSMLSKYPKDFVKFRNQFKPGLIPPYYIDRPKTFNELIESEKRYLLKYKKSSFEIDISYFFKFLGVVFLKGVRSS